jgi:hypothetical protein
MATEADLVRSIDAEALAEWVPAQRWFASKAREVHVGLLEVLVLNERPLLGLALVEARFAAGTHDLYQLLVGPGELEALTTPEPAEALARLLTSEARVQGEHGTIAFHWSGDQLDAARLRFMGAEQSNTSIVIDESVVLKVFRRLEAGDNPELEMVRFLTEHGFPNVPALKGWYALEGDVLDATVGTWFGTLFLAVGAISLFAAALGIVDYVARLVADVIHVGYTRDRRGITESRLYFTVVWGMVLFGSAILLLGFDQPLVLVTISTVLGGAIMFVYTCLLLVTNRRYLPAPIRLRGYRVAILLFAVALLGATTAIVAVDQVGNLL